MHTKQLLIDRLELWERIGIKIPLRCWNISLKEFEFRYLYDIEREREMFIDVRLKIWIRISVNYPAIYIAWIVISFGYWIVDGFKNWSSMKKKIHQWKTIKFYIYSYLEIKPPPIGSASRIDNWSLRDVTTCCQTLLASILLLFACRLRISRRNFNANNYCRSMILFHYRLFYFEFLYLMLHLLLSIQVLVLVHF